MIDKDGWITTTIDFLHDARPYRGAGAGTNIPVSFPPGALPNTRDIIQLDGIEPPKGAFFVHHRAFAVRQGSLCDVTLTLGVEGGHKANTDPHSGQG